MNTNATHAERCAQKKARLALIGVAIFGAALSPRCSQITVTRVPTDSVHDPSAASAKVVQGIRYSLPKPILRVSGDGAGGLAIDVLYVPDDSHTYAIDAGTVSAAYSLTTKMSPEGFLNEVGFTRNETKVAEQLIASAGTLTSKAIEENQKRAQEAEKQRDERRKALVKAASDAVNKAQTQFAGIESARAAVENAQADLDAARSSGDAAKIQAAEATLRTATAAFTNAITAARAGLASSAVGMFGLSAAGVSNQGGITAVTTYAPLLLAIDEDPNGKGPRLRPLQQRGIDGALATQPSLTSLVPRPKEDKPAAKEFIIRKTEKSDDKWLLKVAATASVNKVGSVVAHRGSDHYSGSLHDFSSGATEFVVAFVGIPAGTYDIVINAVFDGDKQMSTKTIAASFSE